MVHTQNQQSTFFKNFASFDQGILQIAYLIVLKESRQSTRTSINLRKLTEI